MIGLLTRRAGLIAYIAAAVGIGCCLAVAAPIGASVVVRRRRRQRKRKETDGRLQESLRSMLSTDGGGCASSNSLCDVVKMTSSGASSACAATLPEVVTTSGFNGNGSGGILSPYHQRNGFVCSATGSLRGSEIDRKDGTVGVKLFSGLVKIHYIPLHKLCCTANHRLLYGRCFREQQLFMV